MNQFTRVNPKSTCYLINQSYFTVLWTQVRCIEKLRSVSSGSIFSRLCFSGFAGWWSAAVVVSWSELIIMRLTLQKRLWERWAVIYGGKHQPAWFHRKTRTSRSSLWTPDGTFPADISQPRPWNNDNTTNLSLCHKAHRCPEQNPQ